MKTLMLKPDIYNYDTAKEFAEDFMLGEGDLVVTNEYIYNPYFGGLNLKCDVIFQEKYGMGEPSDDMVEAMCRDIKGEHKRVVEQFWTFPNCLHSVRYHRFWICMTEKSRQ